MSATELINAPKSPYGGRSWEYAVAFADSLGQPPASINFLVRTLLSEGDKGGDAVGRDATMYLSRFLKSRAFKSPYFHAVSFYRTERLGADDDPFLARDFIEAFSCEEHALISGLIFVHRMAARRAESELVKEITDRMQRTLNLGWFIGKALKPVGPGMAMSVGAARWLGLLPIASHDPDGFRSYMSGLKRSDQAVSDERFETERWGCASVQVALIMLQRVGFGANRLIPLMRALTTTSFSNSVEPVEKVYRVAEIWLSYMLESRSAPSSPLQPAFYLGKDRINEISQRMQVASNSFASNWLSATGRDLCEATAPQLFCGEASHELAADNGEDDLLEVALAMEPS